MELLKLDFFAEVKNEMDDITAALKDTEVFITTVLARCKLPPDVDKQRKKLSERLHNLLNKLNEVEQKPTLPQRKGRPPSPTEDFYDDTDPQNEVNNDNAKEPITEEMYDDVSTEAAAKEPITEGSQEMYDDVAEATGDNSFAGTKVNGQKTASLSSEGAWSTASLKNQDIVGPRKASEIKDKIYEGYVDKYKTKGFFKFSTKQRRYCVLSPMALYYYADQKDSRQKGAIVLPASGFVLRRGCPSHPELKLDEKLHFELDNKKRIFLFKVEKEEDCARWMHHIEDVIATKLTAEDSAFVRTQSMSAGKQDQDEIEDVGGEMYEDIERYNLGEPSETSNGVEQQEEEEFEEMYEDTDNFSTQKVPEKTTDVPSRNEKLTVPPTPSLPPRPTASQPPPPLDAPILPPRGGDSAQASKPQPPQIPARTTPPMEKKTPPVAAKPGGPTPPDVVAESKPEVIRKPDVVPSTMDGGSSQSPPAVQPKYLEGEQFDYARVYVALYNCVADDDDDLAFSRGNQVYIREKVPNSDWWVASLMDRPDVRVGLVPRNYLMPAYDL